MKASNANSAATFRRVWLSAAGSSLASTGGTMDANVSARFFRLSAAPPASNDFPQMLLAQVAKPLTLREYDVTGNRRQSNGEQVSRVASLAMKRGKPVDFTGWQRHIVS
jgi:hypothetical protein